MRIVNSPYCTDCGKLKTEENTYTTTQYVKGQAVRRLTSKCKDCVQKIAKLYRVSKKGDKVDPVALRKYFQEINGRYETIAADAARNNDDPNLYIDYLYDKVKDAERVDFYPNSWDVVI